MPLKPFSRGADLHDHDKGRLPHWRQWGATYFVTSRLADSVPAALRDEWRQRRDTWLAAHCVSDPEVLSDELRQVYHREFTPAFHALLDAGHGECVLARPECAEILIGRLLAGHGRAYQLDAWVVMPNHLHALVEPAKGTLLGEVVKSWKGGSARNQCATRTAGDAVAKGAVRSHRPERGAIGALPPIHRGKSGESRAKVRLCARRWK